MPITLETISNFSRIRSDGNLNLDPGGVAAAGLTVQTDGNISVAPSRAVWITNRESPTLTFQSNTTNEGTVLSCYANSATTGFCNMTLYTRSSGSPAVSPIVPDNTVGFELYSETSQFVGVGMTVRRKGTAADITNTINYSALGAATTAYPAMVIRRTNTGTTLGCQIPVDTNSPFWPATDDAMSINSRVDPLNAPNVQSGFGCAMFYMGGSVVGGRDIFVLYRGEPFTLVGTLHISTTVFRLDNYSDYRKKTAVDYFTDGIQQLRRIRPVRFNWANEDPGPSKRTGFLAHEFQEVIPQAVTGQRDEVDARGRPKYQYMDSRPIISLLTGAVKELAHKIQGLRDRVESMGAQ